MLLDLLLVLLSNAESTTLPLPWRFKIQLLTALTLPLLEELLAEHTARTTALLFKLLALEPTSNIIAWPTVNNTALTTERSLMVCSMTKL
jgi:hypothetical protein